MCSFILLSSRPEVRGIMKTIHGKGNASRSNCRRPPSRAVGSTAASRWPQPRRRDLGDLRHSPGSLASRGSGGRLRSLPQTSRPGGDRTACPPRTRILRTGRFSYAVSTGSSIAVPFLCGARLRGVSSHYIESATRLSAPSLTGRILARAPGVHVYSQTRGWRGRHGTIGDRCSTATTPAHRLARRG